MSTIEVFSLAARLDLNADEFNQGLQRAESRGKGFGQRFGGAMKTAGKATLGVAGIVAGAGAAALAAGNKFADQADKIDKASSRAGVSAEEYQEMTFALGQLGGISEQTAERGIGRLNQRMGRAREGNEKYREALQAVGISLEDVDNGTLSASDAMDQAVTNLGNMDDATQRAALAGELFGTKVGRDLQPALEAGGEAFGEMRDRAHEAGAVMSDEGVAAGVKFTDQMDEVQKMLGSVWREIMIELMPVLNSFLSWVREHMPAIREFVSDAMEGMSSAWENQLKPAFEAIRPLLETILPILTSLFQNGFQVVTGAIQLIASLLTGDFAAAWEAARKIVGGVVDFLSDIADAILGDFIEGIRNGLSGLRDAAASIFNAVWEEISGLPGRILQLGRDLVGGLVEGIGERVGDAKDAVTGLFSGIFGRAEEEAETASPSKRMMRLGADLIEGLNLGLEQTDIRIEGTIGDVMDRINEKAGKLSDSIKEWQAIARRSIHVRVDTSAAEQQLENLRNKQAAILRAARQAHLDRVSAEVRASQFGPGTMFTGGPGMSTPRGPQPLTEAGPGGPVQRSPSVGMASRRDERARVQADRQNIDRFQRATDQFSNDVQRLALANLRY